MIKDIAEMTEFEKLLEVSRKKTNFSPEAFNNLSMFS